MAADAPRDRITIYDVASTDDSVAWLAASGRACAWIGSR
jgi:hypothetical protein